MSHTMEDIEQLTEAYANARQSLELHTQELEDELRLIKSSRIDFIRRAAQRAHERAAELKAAIEASPELFERPRTRVLHGVKVGIQKGKGRLVWDDEQQVLKRIKQLYDDEIGVLVNVIERPNRAALQELPAAELKRLGVRVVDDGDYVVIRSSDSAVDKLVDALLSDESLQQQPAGESA